MENIFNYPKRKPTRLKSFDYSTNGAYFVTICTHERKNILSIIDEFSNNAEDQIKPKLTKYGKITEKIISQIPEKYESVSVDSYEIMPNHIHLLLTIFKSGRDDPSPTPFDSLDNGRENTYPSPFDSLDNGRDDHSPTPFDSLDNGRENPSPTVATVIGWLKFQATKKINKERNSSSEKIFQRSFHDHIIRNSEDYYETQKYIQDNPLRWQFDKLYFGE